MCLVLKVASAQVKCVPVHQRFSLPHASLIFGYQLSLDKYVWAKTALDSNSLHSGFVRVLEMVK